MKKIFSLIAAVLFAGSMMAADAKVTLDFTDAGWGFPADYVTTDTSYTYGGYTIAINAPDGHKVLTVSKTDATPTGLIFGKNGATLTLPAFDFPVSKIVVTGLANASGKVTTNIFVGADAVSAAITGSKEVNTFRIASDKQAAGNIFVLKITNANNAQAAKIEIFENDGTEEEEPIINPDTVSVSEAIALIDAKDNHAHYVKGVIATQPFNTFNSGFAGRVSFFMVDEVTNTDSIEAYQIYDKENKEWASLEAAWEELRVGDTVLVYAGALKLYAAKSIYEIDPGNYVEKLGANPNPPEIVDPDAKELPEGVISCDSALVLTAPIADPEAAKGVVKSDVQVVVRGYVSRAFNVSNGTQSAWLGDKKGVETIQASYLEITTTVAVGDYVEVTGTLAKYKKDDGTIVPEIVDGTMYKVAELGIENVVLTEQAQKVMVDGIIYIVRDNKMFNIHGTQVR